MDNINHPAHYNQGKVECIDVIESAMGKFGLQHYCLGNVFKYLYRCHHKGAKLQDLEKAQWYLNKLITMIKEDQANE